jgi:hypothetical protein
VEEPITIDGESYPACNRVDARGGSWCAGRAADGYRVWFNGSEILGVRGWDVACDGPVLTVQTHAGLDVYRDGRRGSSIPCGELRSHRLRGAFVGLGQAGRAFVVALGFDEQPTDVTVSPSGKESCPIVVDGWVWSVTEVRGTTYVQGHPLGASTVLVRERPIGSQDWIDVVHVGGEWIVASCHDQGRMVVESIPDSEPRRSWGEILPPAPSTEVVDIPPFAFPFYAACYKDASLQAPANIIFAPEPLSVPITGPAIVGPFRTTVDFAVGWTLATENVEATRTAALACKAVKDLPVYAYLGGYVPEAIIDGVDFPLLQAYRGPGLETADAILTQLRGDLARCAYARVGLAVDLTDRTLPGVGGWPESDRVAFLVGIADLCRMIQPVGVFAWAWDRRVPQAGIASSPVITEQWRRFVDAIPQIPDLSRPDPPTQPEELPMPPPYSEQDALTYNATIRDAYREAGREPDDVYPIWGDRAQYDYASGALSWAASCVKHLAECRDALGLHTPMPPPVVADRRIVRANFCNLTDSMNRPIFSSCLAAQSPEMQEEWITRERLAGGTHYVLSIQTGYGEHYPVERNFYRENSMDEWLGALDRVLDAGLVPVVMLDPGNAFPGVDYLRAVLRAIPASYYVRAIWCCGWETVAGAWTSAQFFDANRALREELGPTALMACHLTPGRASFSSHPVEPDDPWQGDEIACWHDHWPGGHPFSVFLYQSPPPPEGAAFDPTIPDSWAERAKEVADRFLGLPGAPDWFSGITRPTLIWFEATATQFIRGQSSSAWARTVARHAQTLGYQGFGNGLPYDV